MITRDHTKKIRLLFNTFGCFEKEYLEKKRFKWTIKSYFVYVWAKNTLFEYISNYRHLRRLNLDDLIKI